MKTITAVVFLSLFLISNSYCQLGGYEDFMTNPSWEFYSGNTLSAVASGKGFTGIAGTGDISSVVLNPASLNIEKDFQINLGYTYKSTITQYGYPDYLLYKTNLPTVLIGGVYKINKYLQGGFIYRNNYSYRIVLEQSSNIIVGSESNDDVVYNFTTHNFSVPLAFNYKWLRLGTDLNLTYYRMNSNGGQGSDINGYSDLMRFVPQFGFIITPVNNFSFGATFIPGFSDSVEYHMDRTTLTYNRKSLVRFPNRIGIGTELRLIDNKLLFALDYQFAGTSKLKQEKDMHNFHFGTEYAINESWKIRGGFYTLLDFHDYGTNSIATENYDQYFITLGGTYKYKYASFNLALMDSHLFSDALVRHNKVVGSVAFDL